MTSRKCCYGYKVTRSTTPKTYTCQNESPQEFADRSRALAQKITCQVDDPVAHGVHREHAERMLLASYVADLIGVSGKQVRYASPVLVEEAKRIAVSVQEAER